MSRFADPKATARMELGACKCPGAPHAEGDWIELRTQLGSSDIARIKAAGDMGELVGFELCVVAWNLLDDDGSKATVDRAHIDRLYSDVLDAFADWTNDNLQLEPVPNAPAARSRSSSRASGTRTRHLRKVS